MTVEDMKKLVNGEKVKVLDGQGMICIDFEVNMFLAITEDDNSLDVHETIEEALGQIEDYYELTR